MNLKSTLDRFELASIKRMYENAKTVKKHSGGSMLFILSDMGKCILKDNIGYMEYNLFNFKGKPKKVRDTYITFDKSQKLFKTLNDPNYLEVFDNKLLFNEKFKDFIGRDFIDAAHCSDEQFISFCKGKDEIFCKPKDSCSGKGIYKSIKIDKDTDLVQLHKFMIEHDLFCEDTIHQHPELSKLNPSSINTIRVTTVLVKDTAYVMYALLRIGTSNTNVDNIASGGIYTVLDEKGTIVHGCWSDKTLVIYDEHPLTKEKLIGFKVPMFEEALELCKKAALVEPHVRYVGWDVAITDKGPIMVEGNQLPGYDMAQNYYASGVDHGLLPKFEEILKNEL